MKIQLIAVMMMMMMNSLGIIKCFSQEKKTQIMLVLLTTELRRCSETEENKSSVYSNVLK